MLSRLPGVLIYFLFPCAVLATLNPSRRIMKTRIVEIRSGDAAVSAIGGAVEDLGTVGAVVEGLATVAVVAAVSVTEAAAAVSVAVVVSATEGAAVAVSVIEVAAVVLAIEENRLGTMAITREDLREDEAGLGTRSGAIATEIHLAIGGVAEGLEEIEGAGVDSTKALEATAARRRIRKLLLTNNCI